MNTSPPQAAEDANASAQREWLRGSNSLAQLFAHGGFVLVGRQVHGPEASVRRGQSVQIIRHEPDGELLPRREAPVRWQLADARGEAQEHRELVLGHAFDHALEGVDLDVVAIARLKLEVGHDVGGCQRGTFEDLHDLIARQGRPHVEAPPPRRETFQQRLVCQPTVAVAEVLEIDVPEQRPFQHRSRMADGAVGAQLAALRQEFVARLLEHGCEGLESVQLDGVPDSTKAIARRGLPCRCRSNARPLRKHPAVACLLLWLRPLDLQQQV
mmetsp:Transcript_72592/g.234619  ORF Transcript_72592/g.234619 Transcript_72592/m.234619 type:complete len:270 (-) Transcript_72592:4972-5781(-)